MTYVLGQTAETINSFSHLAEQGGLFGALLVILTVCLIASWKLAIYPFLKEVSAITSQIAGIVTVINENVTVISESAKMLVALVRELKKEQSPLPHRRAN